MSFWDLYNAAAASKVKIGVFEEVLAKEKASTSQLQKLRRNVFG